MSLGSMASRMRESVSVILAVYEHADVLDVVIRALSEQEDRGFEIVIADDGSGDEVGAVVESWRGRLPIEHVWQPDEGFRKARALNLAALAAGGDYLVFLDGDCVPRRGLMSAIRRSAREGWFLATKRIMLGEQFSRVAVEEGVPIWRWSTLAWLVRAPREVGRLGYLVPVRDRPRADGDFTPPFRAYPMFGVARADFFGVNGYDARCVSSEDGEDQDLAIRLRRDGLRCAWPGPAATLLHLWHPVRADRVGSRTRVFWETQSSDHVEAVLGLRELSSAAC